MTWIIFIIGVCFAGVIGMLLGWRACKIDRSTEADTCDVNVLEYVLRQKNWSTRAFGPPKDADPKRLIAHIEKELDEIRIKPTDCEEWVDVIILAIEGAWRTGHSPMAITHTLRAKQEKNFVRTWVIPDNPLTPIEHDRYDERESNP